MEVVVVGLYLTDIEQKGNSKRQKHPENVVVFSLFYLKILILLR